jgi:Zn-dependent M28 family amino/carboxypeptidase
VVLSAHVDGYGIGEPWGRDNIYNGAFDDAAYVATLIDFAEKLRASGTALRRSLLFTVVTGEEKGLLGSRYYTQHLTVPQQQLVANINLDQLQPVFPLHTLTMHALDESTLGDTARQVAAAMNITIQADPEPLRNLMRRSDNWNFMQLGVPATGFIFGYAPGSSDEVAYRRWYADRYHTPLDDLSQPWVPDAAARFNEFFGRLVTALANADEAPRWKPGSEFAPR